MFDEDEWIPLSALQHFVFCPRQCALIHVERQWAENRLTAEGRILHEKADSGFGESRGDLRIARGLALRSRRLGLVGRADVVEFLRIAEPVSDSGIELDGVEGRWRPRPVEYKRGRPKLDACDEVQLCAQALCLEEQFGVEIKRAALYYAGTRHREEIVLDGPLRRQTERSARAVRQLLSSGRTPPAVREPKCSSCSLLDLCLPSAGSTSVQAYLEHLFDSPEDP